jgi:hypothetical protein
MAEEIIRSDKIPDSIEIFRAALQINRAWEPGLVMVFAGEVSEKFNDAGLICQEVAQLRCPDGTVPYSAFARAKLSCQVPIELPPSIPDIDVGDSTLEGLVSALRRQPRSSAIFIDRLEDVWATAPTEDAVKQRSWTTPKGKIRTLAGRAASGIAMSLRSLVEVAKEGNLLIVATSYLDPELWSRFAPDLDNLNGLAWCRLTGSHLSVDEDWFIGAIADMKKGILTFDELRNQILSRFSHPLTQQTTLAQALAANGRHYEAWQTMKPFAEKFGRSDVSIQLRLAQMAMDALDVEASKHWIKSAEILGIRLFQDWCIAIRLSELIGDSELETSLMSAMAIHFPNEAGVVDWEVRYHLVGGRFDEAAVAARKGKRTARASALELISTGRATHLDFIKSALDDEDKGFALQALAIFYEHRANHTLAVQAAKSVPKGCGQEVSALRLRWREWGRMVAADVSDDDSLVNDLIRLIADGRDQSRDVNVRLQIDRVCLDEITPSSSRVLFSRAALFLLSELTEKITNRPWEGPISMKGEEADLSQVVPFGKAWMEVAPSRLMILGYPYLDDKVQKMATPELARTMTRLIQSVESQQGDPLGGLTLLMGIERICAHVGDPSFDVLAALLLVRKTGMSGDGQTARNLAEDILRGIPESQPKFSTWRTGGAWLVVAESFLVAGSAVESLRFLCLAMDAMAQQCCHIEIVAEVATVLVRSLRDLGLLEHAESVLRLEQRLRKIHGDEYGLEKSIDMEAMLELRRLRPGNPGPSARFTHRMLRRLRKMTDADDRLPIVALALNGVRFLRRDGIDIWDHMMDEIKICVDTDLRYHPLRMQQLVPLLRWPPSRHWFVDEADRMSRAIRSEDMDTQLARVAVFARESFVHASEIDDIDLALTSSVLLSQPALMFRSETKTTEQDRANQTFRRFVVGGQSQTMTDEVVRDVSAIIKSKATDRVHSLVKPIRINIADIQHALTDDEALLIIVHDTGWRGELAALIIRTSSAATSFCMLTNGWRLEDRFGWDQPYRMPGSAEPKSLSNVTDDAIIDGRFRNLGIRLDQFPQKLIIVPDASLFAFPFGLMPLLRFTKPDAPPGFVELEQSGVRIGDVTQVSSSPSIEHWLKIRSSPAKSLGRRKLWIGESVDDSALQDASGLFPGLIDKFELERIDSRKVPDFAECALGILVAHGNRTSAGELATVSDDLRHMVPEQIGALVRDCGCMILGVCFGGASQSASGSHESWGIVASALAAGSRCVIAPSFAITVGFLHGWLGQFLQQMECGRSVGEAVDLTNRSRTSLAERGAMQVFGDDSFRMAVQDCPQG